jgi:asparagine synthase (glutamine-hydrolysing)
MCGICGVVGFPPGPGRDAIVASMSDALAHRGPDDAAAWADRDAAFGFRRLAIIDLEGGRQPMTSEDGSLHLILNGEIYNHRELRRELESGGRPFRTRSDVEAALRILERDGPAGLGRLHGMFALAAWNSRDRTLLLARDRIGKKPLVYWTDGARVAFASEIQALLRIPEVKRDLDPEAVASYLAAGAVPAPRTMFRSIRKLLPGQWILARDGRLTTGAMPPHPALAPFPDRAAARAWVRTEVTRAVETRLESDVPLGVLLSGGIDSTILLGLVASKLGRPVPTFTATFSEAAFDESAEARVAASRFGADHHEFMIEPDAGEILPLLVRHFGEPFADPAAVPTWELARRTREHVKTAISGDGGDEAFGGYLRYRALRLLAGLRRIPAPVRWLAFLAPLSKKYRSRARSLIGRSSLPLNELYAELLAPIDAPTRRRLYPGPEAVIDPLDGADPVAAASALDARRYLPDDLLVKTDISSMAHGLEIRCPFADSALLAGSAALPGAWKIEGRTTKAILRETFQDLLPPEIAKARKRGFGIPLDAWLRGPLRAVRDDLLRDRSARTFDPATVESLVREHDQGADRGRALWTLMVFEAWRRWIERGRPLS